MALNLSNTFTHYTYRNASQIAVSKNKEKAFQTCFQRSFNSYIKKFLVFNDRSLNLFLDSFGTRKFSCLDGGGGNGRALRTLLERYAKVPTTITCHGISLHLFNKVRKLLEKHPKTEWFHGDALRVLKTLPSNSYDLITDVFGAYFYSIEHYEILQEYHRVLKPEGRCYLVSKPIQQIKIGEKILERKMEQFLQLQAPETFFLNDNFHRMMMVKKSLRFPIPLYLKVKMSTPITMVAQGKRKFQELVEGCAVTQGSVTYEERPTKRANLRELPINYA